MGAPALGQRAPRKIHRQFTFAKPVLNRLASTVSDMKRPPKIAVVEGGRASQNLLWHGFERDGFEVPDTLDGASCSEFRFRKRAQAIVLTAIGGSLICKLFIEDSQLAVSRVISPTPPRPDAPVARAGSRRLGRAAIHALHPRGRNTDEGRRRGFRDFPTGVPRGRA